MSWVQTYTGRKFDFHNIAENDISVIDIAWALSQQCRYNGHTKRFYSVAEHSVLMSSAALGFGASKEVALEMLLHDAAEAYTGDIVRPLKNMLPGFQQIESKINKAIRSALGLTEPAWMHKKIVKVYDNRILLDERSQLMHKTEDDWAAIDGIALGPLGVEIAGWRPETACMNFLYAYQSLTEPALMEEGPKQQRATAKVALYRMSYGGEASDR